MASSDGSLTACSGYLHHCFNNVKNFALMIIMKFGTILNDEGLTKMNKVANSDSCVRPYDNHAERSGGSCGLLWN